MTQQDGQSELPEGHELAKSLTTTLRLLKALWNEGAKREKAKREKLKKYLLLEGRTAKVLYAILKLQHAHASQDRMGLPQATQAEIERLLHMDRTQVSRTLQALVSANYVVVADCSKGDMAKSDSVYEIEVKTAISCRDTAALLLELLAYAKRGSKGATGCDRSRDEGDLKFDRVPFVNSLFKADKEESDVLWYYDKKDLLGRPHHGRDGKPYDGYYTGKLNELADAGEYIERVSADWIRPRMKITLEIPYLLLVRDQVSLDQLKQLDFDMRVGEYGKWVPQPLGKPPRRMRGGDVAGPENA
jgi:DNA-binding MarR family transcriptional regulator